MTMCMTSEIGFSSVPGWDVGVYWTENENAFEPWQTTWKPQDV